jgi:hypothetical protein
MKKINYLLFLIFVIALTNCKKSTTSGSGNDNSQPSSSYSFVLSGAPFLVADGLGLAYFNDITVGVLKNNSSGIKLITASGNSTIVLDGMDLTKITSVSTLITPNSQDTSSYYHNYIGLGKTIQDRNGILYSVFHAEWWNGRTLPGNVSGFFGSIGIGISNDGGKTFSLSSSPIIPTTYSRYISNGNADGGYGEPTITYNKDSSFVYVYFTDHNRDGRGVNICMVKFNVLSHRVPDFTTCQFLLYNSTFTTSIIRSAEIVSGGNYGDAIFPDVNYNNTTGKYYMVYNLNDYDEYFTRGIPTYSGIYLRESLDGINWTLTPQKLISDWAIPFNVSSSYTWHPTIIYTSNDMLQGYLVYSKSSLGLSTNGGHKMWAQPFKFVKK